MPQNDLEQLQSDNIILRARNTWLENVNQKLVVMIRNAADVLDGYATNLDEITKSVQESQSVYDQLHTDLQEALNEQSQRSTDSGLHKSQERNVHSGRRGTGIGNSSDHPNPFGDG